MRISHYFPEDLKMTLLKVESAILESVKMESARRVIAQA